MAKEGKTPLLADNEQGKTKDKDPGFHECKTCHNDTKDLTKHPGLVAYIATGVVSAVLGLILLWICTAFFIPFLIWAAGSAGFYFIYARGKFISHYTLNCKDKCNPPQKVTVAQYEASITGKPQKE